MQRRFPKTTHHLRAAGHAGRGCADELVAEFGRTGFFDLADKYMSPVTDEPSLIISITLDGKTKTVEGEGQGAPERLVELRQKIDEAVNSNQWMGFLVG